MVLFINDRPITITEARKDDLKDEKMFDRVLDLRLDILRAEHLEGRVLLLNGSPVGIENLLDMLHTDKYPRLQCVVVQVPVLSEVKDSLKRYFKWVKAAGGIVFNEADEMLLIYRLGCWDLPKGKLDFAEKSREAAVREVQEETGAVVSLGEKICTTWHTYTQNESRILKKTKWYRMTLLSDNELIPQAEEGIEKLAWMNKQEAQNALINSYSSIRYVFEQL